MAKDQSISHEIVGSEGPWLVFVHGLTCDRSDWQAQVAALQDSYRCLLVDTRGHGASSTMSPPYNVPTDAQDLASLLEHHQIRNAVLIGHSRGVRVIAATALLAPETTGGLVFVDGSQQGVGEPEAARKAVLDKIAAAPSVEQFNANMFSAMFPAGTPALGRDAIIRRAAAMAPATYLELLGDMVRWDAAAMEQTFAALPVPVGVLQSTTLNEQRQRRTIGENESTPYLDMIRNTVPDAIVQCVPDTGHFTQLDAPDAVCDMIRAIAARQRH